MKLTILLMTTFLLQVHANGFAQNVSLNQRNTTLKQLFSQIRKQTGYNILWQEGKVNDGLKVDAVFDNSPLEKVLDRVLAPKSLTYNIINRTIVIKKADKPFFDKVADFFSSIDIDGKILDAETGAEIPKVTITLKGTARTVLANEHGTFRFASLPDDAILVFSSIGYVTQELKASPNMTIKMVMATKELQEVMVSTGYQTLKKISTTGSFGVLTAKDIERRPKIDLLEGIQGTVPGVAVDLRNNKIQIRGVSSYLSNYAPLIVIDGFPAISQSITSVTSNGINGNPSNPIVTNTSGNAILGQFNPDDIESITFLKDAAASSIWGARAANGVIVVTTKKGKRGANTINFSSMVSTSAPADFSKLTAMNSSDYIDLEQELVDKNFVSDPVAAIIASPTNGYRSAPVSEAQEWMFKAKRNPAYTAQRDSALNVLRNRSNQDQLRDYLLQRAVTQQYNLSFSGGTDNSSYYISGNYTKDQPIYKSNSAKSYNINTSFTNDFLRKRITLNTGLVYNYQSAQVNAAALQALGVGIYGMAPYDQLVDKNGNRIYRGVTFTTRVSDSLTRTKNLLPWTYNAIDELDYNHTITNKNNIRLNASLKGVITSWLNVTVSGQYQKSIADQINNQNLNSYLTRDLINNSTNPLNLTNSSYLRVNGVPKGSVYKTSRSTFDDYGLRGQLNANKSFGSDHQFDLIAGTEIRESKYQGSEQTLYGYDEERSTSVAVTPTISYNTLTGSTGRLTSQGTVFKNRTRYLSYYSNGTYSFKEKYYISGSVRFDDINIIGVDRRDRARPLWSSGLRWDLKKEKFLTDLNWISSLSLRGTVGTAGNPPLASSNFTTINSGFVDNITQLAYVMISNPANQDIGWETTKMVNGGVDASFLNNRISFALDLYSKRTTDILINQPINSAYGFSTLQFNSGSLAGHGVDLGLTGRIIQNNKFSWSSTVNFSYNTNEVTDSRFPPTTVSVGTATITSGYPLDNLFVYRWAGLDNTGQSQIYTANGTIVKSTASTAIKPEDRTYVGRTTAPYFGGFLNVFSYKNFELFTRITYSLGHKFLIQNINSSNYPNNASSSGLLATSQALVNRWKKPGDEANTDVPGLSGTNFNSVSRYMYSDLNVRDAGNIRFQQISLNYNVPQYMLKKAPFIRNLSAGFTLANLGLLWVANREKIDPDYQMTGSFINLPPTRSYVFNLKLTL
ncbi:SusC/RagA family TonB-linked outer membrane protein [Pedobacter sp. BMA]|uniref:SusC/RagA family TonB-linked outer membrane protein n=1 Tax=Pedobacter sp. BMA TaxID=1663685 RepID=UPI001E614480|nr:SusC/RagA family TonB-linked outer membrane protein [Pedobacter sp. BMA]